MVLPEKSPFISKCTSKGLCSFWWTVTTFTNIRGIASDMLPSESMSSISIEVLVRVYCHCLQTLSYSRQSEIFFCSSAILFSRFSIMLL